MKSYFVPIITYCIENEQLKFNTRITQNDKIACFLRLRRGYLKKYL